jgi:hypothetical protein
MVIKMEKQVYYLSVLGVLSSIFFGSGILLLIPTLTQCINIKSNYVTYDKQMISNTLFYCIIGIILNIISLLFYFLFALPRL